MTIERPARRWRASRRAAAGLCLAVLALTGCAYPYTPPALPSIAARASAPIETRSPVTILISIDGFRPDYLDRGATPRLSALARRGVGAPMIPAFPTKTFPNHWTLVTGLVPDRHGIVGNTMEDAGRPGEKFTMATDDPFWWNAAEPIWATAERAGVRTATMFWPGANVAWGGVVTKGENRSLPVGGKRPASWAQFAQAMTGSQRVDAVIDWLRRSVATRPRFLTLYFDTVDSIGHDAGPDSTEVNAELARVDAEIGRLLDEMAALGQPANLVIVSDHGMAATSSDRVIALDRIAPASDWRALETGPYASLFPMPGSEAALAQALAKPHPRMTCWPKAALPARLDYGRHPRVPPWLCLAATGWLIEKTMPAKRFVGGAHGYDQAAPEMRALFLAAGPAFRSGVTLPPVANTAVAPLLRRLLGLPAGVGLDGSDAPFREALR